MRQSIGKRPCPLKRRNPLVDGPWRFGTVLTMFLNMPMPIDHADYSVVVKLREPLPNSWRWVIYRARAQASVFFHTMAAARRSGKEALKQLLDKLHSKHLRWPAA